ncbi:hypothetical protein [Streptomyces caatingaensis]|uniref:WXG100 family type VII secretion target n=1 Tax=Streptomyces caatingaensis TaxID=1678637 RepID=A0A0K9XHV3_9ACTN|nr:hypothetical protein [Streptomyces caatingaensis]KNB52984.1 hypothetical protein AC230_10295 [Streptomyces caatingaensis]
MIDDDITGLNGVATDYTSAVGKYDESSKVLNNKVNGIVHEAGWTGEGAAAFQARWAHDGTIAAAMAEAMSQTSDVISLLTEELTGAKNDLADVQETARAAGLTLDSQGGATGKADQQAALDAYRKGRDAALARAQSARESAAQSLNALVDQMLNKGSSTYVNGADVCTLSDVLRGLYTIPAASPEARAKKLEKLRQRAQELKRGTAKSLAHNKLPKGSDDWNRRLQQRREARAKLTEQRLKLTSAEARALKGRYRLSGPARATFGDISESYGGKGLGAAGKLGAASTVLNAGMVGLQMYDDMRTRNWSWQEALARDATPAAAGMAAGTVVEGGLAAATAVSVPASAAVGLGIVAAYGVGTFGYELTHSAHWGSNIHKYGVVEGIGRSFGDAGKEWVKSDVVGMTKKVGHTAMKAWHGLFG